MMSTNATSALAEGIAAARAGDKARARKLLQQAAHEDSGSELAWLWLAGVAESPQESCGWLERVLAINPENDRARRGLLQARVQMGVAEAKAGKKRLAARIFHDVTRQDPNCELAWLWLAGVIEAPGEAIACLQRVLAINPQNQHAQAGLKTTYLKSGIAEYQRGDKDAARQHFQAVVELDPNHEQAWHWLANVPENPGDSVRCLERVLAINPANARAREALEWFQAQLNKTSDAWQCPLCQAPADEQAELCAACGAVLVLDDIDLFFTGAAAHPEKLEAAIKQYQDTFTENATFAVCYHLGLAHLNLRSFDQAISHFQLALRLRPDNQALRSQLDLLIQRQAETEEQARQAKARQRHVLVVDDSPTIRKLVSMVLEGQGHAVTTAAGGEEALRALQAATPHLVLLDIMMPGMDGYQLCKLIRRDAQTGQVPVIMLSGKDGFFDKIRGKMAGSTAYITKPFTPKVLLQVLGSYIPVTQ